MKPRPVKQPEEKPSFNLEGVQTKSNAVEVPSISLPKGGGALKGIDEKISENAINSTSSFSLPLPTSPARGVTPASSLSYNSASGNDTFRVCWNLSLASIKRKRDKQLPHYLDAIGSDVYQSSQAEDLVLEFENKADVSFRRDANEEYIINEKDSPDNLFRIRFYKPRIEGLFARIERWTDIERVRHSEVCYWTTIGDRYGMKIKFQPPYIAILSNIFHRIVFIDFLHS